MATATVCLRLIPADNMPHMLRQAIDQITTAAQEGSPICLIVPFLTQALAFRIELGLLAEGLTGLFLNSHFPGYMPPALRSLHTLLQSNRVDIPISQGKIAQALQVAIRCDPLRAHLLAGFVHKTGSWHPFSKFPPRIQHRVGQDIGNHYDQCAEFAQALADLNLEMSPKHFLLAAAQRLHKHFPVNGEVLAAALLELIQTQPEHTQDTMYSFLAQLDEGVHSRTNDVYSPEASVVIATPATLLSTKMTFIEHIWLDVTHPTWGRYLETIKLTDSNSSSPITQQLLERCSTKLQLIAYQKHLAMPERRTLIDRLQNSMFSEGAK